MTPGVARPPGFTLIELMLALAVALVATLAAVRLYAHAGAVFRVAQVQQSLTETARLGLSAIRRDVELAGYLAYAKASQITAARTTGKISVRNDCGADWATRLDAPVGGDNNGYRWDCPAWENAPMPAADTLALRYVDPQAAQQLETGRLYLESSAAGHPRLFAARRRASAPLAALASTNAVHARGYYVSSKSVVVAGSEPLPALRVKYLSSSDSGPRILDAEVQPGVEDLQVEFGIETDDAADDGYRSVERYVPANEVAATHRIVAIRIWLLVRSADRERGFAGETLPGYGDRAATTYRDGFRRKLATMTIAIDDAYPL